MLWVRESAQAHRSSVIACRDCRGLPRAAATRSRTLRQYRHAGVVPGRVLVLHRRREHHHQDGGGLRDRSLGLDTGRACCIALLVTQFVAFPAALAVRLARRTHRAQARHPDRARGVRGRHCLRLFPDLRGGVLSRWPCHGSGAGRRAEPVAIAVRTAGAGWQDRGVLRLLQHDGQVRDGPRASAGAIAIMAAASALPTSCAVDRHSLVLVVRGRRRCC